MQNEPKPANGVPQRDMSISRTADEAERTQECMNTLGADVAARRAKKEAEKEKTDS